MGLIKRAFQWDTAFSHDIIRGQLTGVGGGGDLVVGASAVWVCLRETDRLCVCVVCVYVYVYACAYV